MQIKYKKNIVKAMYLGINLLKCSSISDCSDCEDTSKCRLLNL